MYHLDRACQHTWVLPCVYLLSNCQAGWKELPWIFWSRLHRVTNLPMIRSSGHQHINTVPFQFLLLVSLWSDSRFVMALMSVSSTQLLELFPWRYNFDFVAERFKAGVLYSMVISDKSSTFTGEKTKCYFTAFSFCNFFFKYIQKCEFFFQGVNERWTKT